MSTTKESFIQSWENLGAKTDPKPVFESIEKKYNETHRRDHSMLHISNGIRDFKSAKQLATNPDEIIIAWHFHDYEYNTRVPDQENVSKSAVVAVNKAVEADINSESVNRIRRLILVTDHLRIPETIDEQIILDMDKARLGYPRKEFNEYELGVLHEFHWVIDELGREKFTNGRADILERFIEAPSFFYTAVFNKAFGEQAKRNTTRSVRRLRNGILPGEKLGYYAGSFDPFTNGHLWVVEQSAKLFDALLIAPLANPDKPGRFESWDRYSMILHSTRHMNNVGVMPPDDKDAKSYAVSLADEIGVDFLVRGLRDISDLESEQKLVDANSNIGKTLLDEEIPQVHFVPPRSLSGISSSMVMMHVGYKGWEKVVKKYVPKPVLKKLIEKYGDQE